MAVITLTGPTAAGKSTIEAQLRSMGCGVAISHTTRLMRSGEIDGKSYHFVSDVEYDRLKNSGAFIETIELGSRKYAMSKAALNKAVAEGQHVVIVVEPNGAGQIREYCFNNDIRAFSVWVDCGEKLQARRWVTRFVNDMVIGNEVVGNYAERLHLMMTEESDWRTLARRGSIDQRWLYQFKVDSGLSTPQHLAEQILAAVNKTFPGS